jgi:NTP pyrophosphatase (non-canonical NTP hydrolase)
MRLNAYRDEALEFLKRIDALGEGELQRVTWLEEELQQLKSAIDAGNGDKVTHQLYDMLFLLFEIAAVNDSDLDQEWERGAEKKAKKYIK